MEAQRRQQIIEALVTNLDDAIGVHARINAEIDAEIDAGLSDWETAFEKACGTTVTRRIA